MFRVFNWVVNSRISIGDWNKVSTSSRWRNATDQEENVLVAGRKS